MDYLEQRRKLRQMVQERLDYGRDYTDEEVEDGSIYLRKQRWMSIRLIY